MMDRYIPSDSSAMAYRSLPNNLTNRRSMPNLYGSLSPAAHSVFESSVDRRSTTAGSMIQGRESLSSGSQVGQSPKPFQYKGVLAQALGFDSKKKVLNFRPSSRRFKSIKGNSQSRANSSRRRTNRETEDHSNISTESVAPLLSMLSPEFASMYLTQPEGETDSHVKEPRKKVKVQIPHKVLDAPGLRNDFYSNLISWSKSSGSVSVGLGANIYLWSEEQGAVPLPVNGYDIITTLMFSEDDYLIAGTKSGKVVLYSQSSRSILSEYANLGNGVCCFQWLPGSSKAFFAGNETGEVTYFEIEKTISESRLQVRRTFKTHEQQVCGIAISNDTQQIAVGGNDNCCTIWNISDPLNPVLKYSLPHQAAVKAIAYCPWSNSLLATGGGSKDRTIRFWHTNSGTLLDSLNTKGQITSLVWSRSNKQIVATFGFGNATDPILISVYSYPKTAPLIQVPATPNLRVLSAVPSPDHKSICVATNDETVRFYQLWTAEAGLAADAQEEGVFGSDLIELCEGISKTGGIIR